MAKLSNLLNDVYGEDNDAAVESVAAEASLDDVEAPTWAGDEALDAAFAGWTPGGLDDPVPPTPIEVSFEETFDALEAAAEAPTPDPDPIEIPAAPAAPEIADPVPEPVLVAPETVTAEPEPIPARAEMVTIEPEISQPEPEIELEPAEPAQVLPWHRSHDDLLPAGGPGLVGRLFAPR